MIKQTIPIKIQNFGFNLYKKFAFLTPSKFSLAFLKNFNNIFKSYQIFYQHLCPLKILKENVTRTKKCDFFFIISPKKVLINIVHSHEMVSPKVWPVYRVIRKWVHQLRTLLRSLMKNKYLRAKLLQYFRVGIYFFLS